MTTTALIQRTTTSTTGGIAVNVANRFWLLRDEDGVEIHAVDESNTVDDITLGENLGYACDDAAQAVVIIGGFVVLDDAAREAILDALN